MAGHEGVEHSAAAAYWPHCATKSVLRRSAQYKSKRASRLRLPSHTRRCTAIYGIYGRAPSLKSSCYAPACLPHRLSSVTSLKSCRIYLTRHRDWRNQTSARKPLRTMCEILPRFHGAPEANALPPDDAVERLLSVRPEEPEHGEGDTKRLDMLLPAAHPASHMS